MNSWVLYAVSWVGGSIMRYDAKGDTLCHTLLFLLHNVTMIYSNSHCGNYKFIEKAYHENLQLGFPERLL